MNDIQDLPDLKTAYALADQLGATASDIEQGRSITKHLSKLNADTQTLEAALLYPCFHDKPEQKKLITEHLGKTVYKLLSGAQHMDAVCSSRRQTTEFSEHTHQLDTLRKMLLAIVDDIRVVLLKLAERLVFLQSLRESDESAKTKAATEVSDLYAPLANRLGVGQIKWQLEDWAFRYTDPAHYNQISKDLNMRRLEREAYVKHMISELENMLQQSQIAEHEVSGRAKHIYSIYRKIQRKKVDINEIYDSSALRILVPSIKDCYTALSLVHAKWSHIPKEFDDYIANPKPNGYRSIHTAVVGPNDRNVEIQIRTHTMHEESELGVAAHWKYKEGGKQSAYEQKINLLRDILDWQQEVTEDDQTQNHLYQKIFEDYIYVFTPNGDVLEMSAGSTPLDFAYHIHSEIGHRCRGAKINGHIAPLTQTLKTEDCVEILTRKEAQPSRDWLDASQGYLKTAHARSKARQWFKKMDRDAFLEQGAALWEKACRREKLNKHDLDKITSRFHMKTTDDLLIAIGNGDIGIHTILNRLNDKHPEEEIEIKSIKRERKAKHSDTLIKQGGGMLTQLAKCCRPIQGDEILGYITQGRGITIHQKHCPTMQAVFEQRPERLMEISWGENTPSSYPVELIIASENRPALVRDVTNVVLNERAPLLGVTTRMDRAANQALIYLTIETESLDALQRLINQLQQLPNIISIKRRT